VVRVTLCMHLVSSFGASEGGGDVDRNLLARASLAVGESRWHACGYAVSTSTGGAVRVWVRQSGWSVGLERGGWVNDCE